MTTPIIATAHVTTRYHGPTNSRGARVSARTPSGIRVSLPWDWELNGDGNHKAAFDALLAKLEWLIEGPIYTSEAFADGWVFMAPVKHVPAAYREAGQ